MLNMVMINVIVLSVIMLSVVAPRLLTRNFMMEFDVGFKGLNRDWTKVSTNADPFIQVKTFDRQQILKAKNKRFRWFDLKNDFLWQNF